MCPARDTNNPTLAPPLSLRKAPATVIPYTVSLTLLEARQLAARHCSDCHGAGHNPQASPYTRVRIELRGVMVRFPCKCVYREIFRRVLAKYIEIREQEPYMAQRRYKPTARPEKHDSKQASHFAADFEAIARRTLVACDRLIFADYFLSGLNGCQCGERAQMTRENLYHAVYRIEALLGAAFAGTKPYGLFPVREYFI